MASKAYPIINNSSVVPAILIGLAFAACVSVAVPGDSKAAAHIYAGLRLGVWGVGLLLIRIAFPKLIHAIVLGAQRRGRLMWIGVTQTPINPISEISLCLAALCFGLSSALAFSKQVLGTYFSQFAGSNDFTSASLSLLSLLGAEMFFLYHLSGPHFVRNGKWTFLWLCFSLAVSVASAAPMVVL